MNTSQKIPANELDFDSDSEDKQSKQTKKKSQITKIASHNEKYNNCTNHTISVAPEKSITDYLFIDAVSYPFKTWDDFFPKKINLRSLITNPSWNEFFDNMDKNNYIEGIENVLSNYVLHKKIILPYPELVFDPFNKLGPNSIKVVIIGQDPYFNVNKINGKVIPQAMGHSFSVPKNFPKPPSLQNICQNLFDFGHVKKIPTNGCLSYWVAQGCFLINASLTTFFSQANAHKNLWSKITNELITYISTKYENIVFLVWGSFANFVCLNIDPTRHCIITSSHPSPLGCDKTFNGFPYGKDESDRQKVTYPSFRSTDHFGRANAYLKQVNKTEIFWDTF